MSRLPNDSRLTQDYDCQLNGKHVTGCAKYDDTKCGDIRCDDCEINEAVWNKLEYYEDLEEQGELVVQKICNLTQDEEESGYWTCSQCDRAGWIEDGTPFDTDINYCPRCGAYIKTITIKEWRYDEETDEGGVVADTFTRTGWQERNREHE